MAVAGGTNQTSSHGASGRMSGGKRRDVRDPQRGVLPDFGDCAWNGTVASFCFLVLGFAILAAAHSILEVQNSILV